MTSRPRSGIVRVLTLAAWFVGLGCILAFTGCVSVSVTHKRPDDPAAQVEHNLRVFDTAWKRVHDRYYDEGFNGVDWTAAHAAHRNNAAEATDDTTLYRAINAMLAELDDNHTSARAPETVKARRARGFNAIGLNFLPHPDLDEAIVVLRVWPEGDAAHSGVRPGWIMESCNNQPPQDVLGAGKLAAGQTVTCTFRDLAGDLHELPLTARPLKPPANEARRLVDDLIYLRFDEFNLANHRWLMARLQEHRNASGAVIDLRFNRGGNPIALNLMLGRLFADSRVPVGTFITRKGREKDNRSLRLWGERFDLPLAVLISERSSSAAEIFAHAMQVNHRATLIGQPTMGSVLAALNYPLPDGGRLQVSVRDYVGPEGKRLEGVGVEPHILSEQTLADLIAGQDPTLDLAIDTLRR